MLAVPVDIAAHTAAVGFMAVRMDGKCNGGSGQLVNQPVIRLFFQNCTRMQDNFHPVFSPVKTYIGNTGIRQYRIILYQEAVIDFIQLF